MNQLAINAADVRSAADRFERLFQEQRRARAKAIGQTAARIEQHLEQWGASLRLSLQEQGQSLPYGSGTLARAKMAWSIGSVSRRVWVL